MTSPSSWPAATGERSCWPQSRARKLRSCWSTTPRPTAPPFVAFADDDSWWAPGDLERAVAIMRACPRPTVLDSRILVGPEERPDPVCGRWPAARWAPHAEARFAALEEAPCLSPARRYVS